MHAAFPASVIASLDRIATCSGSDETPADPLPHRQANTSRTQGRSRDVYVDANERCRTDCGAAFEASLARIVFCTYTIAESNAGTRVVQDQHGCHAHENRQWHTACDTNITPCGLSVSTQSETRPAAGARVKSYIATPAAPRDSR